MSNMAGRALCNASRTTISCSRYAPGSMMTLRAVTPMLATSRVATQSRYLSSVTARTYATQAEGSIPPVVSSTDEKVAQALKKDSASTLSRTPLYDLHLRHGAKMVPFAGYEMPLTYRWGGQLSEHHQVRKRSGIFDVSHMVQSSISGPGATAFLEHLLPASLTSLQYNEESPYATNEHVVGGPYKSSLSILLNKDGGIIDDLVVTRWGNDSYYVVTNAGRRDEDLAHIKTELDKFNSERPEAQVKHEIIDNGLIALQGPSAASVLQSYLPGVDLDKLYFGQSLHTALDSVSLHIARGGYTGEDGFEISLPAADSIAFTERLLGSAKEGSEAEVQLVGLAPRDSLRLEAGMCLYGHDLSEDVGAVEAGLTWTVGEDRRTESRPFIGAKPTLAAMAAKAPKTRRVGLSIEQGLVAREGTLIYPAGAPVSSDNPEEGAIGRITSGIPSPTLKQNIAMGYVQNGHHKLNTELEVRLRGKTRKAKIAKMPFVKPNYHRAPAAK